MTPQVEIIHDERLTLAEGPHWDHEAQVLYYVDIDESTVFKYFPSTKKITRVVVDKQYKTHVGFVVPVLDAKDKFVIGYGKKLALLTWDGISTDPTSIEILVDVEPELENRFNDGKTDPQGRVWCGTMPISFKADYTDERQGALYSLNANDKTVTKHLDDVGLSNGLAWSSDHKTFYYIDTYNKAIHAFDYDINKGELKNRRTVLDLVEKGIEGFPDGMTIDTEDKLWVATFYGSAVIRVDPKTGSLLQRVDLPASKVQVVSIAMRKKDDYFRTDSITSVAWGGPNLDELYVTSATILEGDEENHYNGRVFKVTGLGVSGRPGVPAKL